MLGQLGLRAQSLVEQEHKRGQELVLTLIARLLIRPLILKLVLATLLATV